MPFANRRDAGRQLADELARRPLERPVVVALPRGGVPVAAEVAARLGALLDVLVVRKLGCPWQPELGIGAVAEGDVRVLNKELIARLGITPAQLDAVAAAEQAELDRRVRRYRGDRAAVSVEGRTVILIDDGLATGFTARTGIEVLRRQGAAQVLLAVPVAPAETVEEMWAVADDVVCLEAPALFLAIGEWYTDFHQITDEEVTSMLAERAAADPPEAPASDDMRIPRDRST